MEKNPWPWFQEVLAAYWGGVYRRNLLRSLELVRWTICGMAEANLPFRPWQWRVLFLHGKGGLLVFLDVFLKVLFDCSDKYESHQQQECRFEGQWDRGCWCLRVLLSRWTILRRFDNYDYHLHAIRSRITLTWACALERVCESGPMSPHLLEPFMKRCSYRPHVKLGSCCDVQTLTSTSLPRRID
jgi:hypothetical protein